MRIGYNLLWSNKKIILYFYIGTDYAYQLDLFKYTIPLFFMIAEIYPIKASYYRI